MKILVDIENAFSHRNKPSRLIETTASITPEQKDAVWFAGLDWRDVTIEGWNDHSDAFYSFVPEAFAYYLPSILVCTLKTPDGWLRPAEMLLGIVDRSPLISNWDAFIVTRLLGFEPQEYDVLKEWLLCLSGVSDLIDDDGLVRAYETVDLLACETLRLREGSPTNFG